MKIVALLLGCAVSAWAIAPNDTVKAGIGQKHGSNHHANRQFTVECDYVNIPFSTCEAHRCNPPAYLNAHNECECPCEYELVGYECVPIPPPPPPPQPKCSDLVPGIGWGITYKEYCGIWGHCVIDHLEYSIHCVCDECYEGPQCNQLKHTPECEGRHPIHPTPICRPHCESCPQPDCPPPPICPIPETPTCSDLVPFVYPPTPYHQACDPGVCEDSHGVRCVCPDCRTGPFCEQEVDSIECKQHNCLPCPTPETCPPCPPDPYCPPHICPPVNPVKTCDSIVSNPLGGPGVTYHQACAVDPRAPHGHCVDEGNGHVYCACNGCWDGLFCGYYDTERCPPDQCTTPSGPGSGPLLCASEIPGLVPALTYNQACEVDISNPHGVCKENVDGTRQCVCNPCWSGTFCEFDMCPPTYTPCPPPPTPPVTPAISCSSFIEGLFPPQTYEEACEVDPREPHGRCEERRGPGGVAELHCVCNKCYDGTFCEDYTCPRVCPPPPTPAPVHCNSPIPEWANGKTYSEECGVDEGRGVCVENGGRLSCKCNECWTGAFCDRNNCIRRCSYNERRPAFYHNPPSPLLIPQPVPGSDLPDELLACPPNFECVPDDKNCQYNRQDCINNIGWCIPTKREVESPANPGDNVRREGAKKKSASKPVHLEHAAKKSAKKH